MTMVIYYFVDFADMRYIALTTILLLLLAVPAVMDISDGTTVSYVYDGEVMFTTNDPSVVPDAPAMDGYTFTGWSYAGQIVDPAKFDYMDGDVSYTFQAVFEKDHPTGVLIAMLVLVGSMAIIVVIVFVFVTSPYSWYDDEEYDPNSPTIRSRKY